MNLYKPMILTLSFLFMLPAMTTNAQYIEKDGTNIQLCLFNPLQVAPEESNVYGLRVTVPYGVNNSVYGLDFGLWSETTGYQYGVQANGLVAYHEEDADGFNLAGIVNYTEKNSTGCIIGGIYSEVKNKMTGFQAAVAIAKARQVVGVQLSLFNYCEDLKGVQLGLININNNGMIPFTIILNFGNSDRDK